MNGIRKSSYAPTAVVSQVGRKRIPMVLAVFMVIVTLMGLMGSVLVSTSRPAQAGFVKNFICSLGWKDDPKDDNAESSNALRPALIYQLTETNDLQKAFYFKSTAGADADNVEKDWANMLSGKDYKAPTIDILNTQNATQKKYTAYDLYGFAGLKWSDYTGEWNWIKVYYCGEDGHGGKEKDPVDQKINLYYDGRNRPRDGWYEISSSRDPRVSLKANSWMQASTTNVTNTLANWCFNLTKLLVSFNNMLFTKSMSNIVGDLGIDVITEKIMMNLFNNLFMSLVVIMMALLGVSIMVTALIQKQFRKAMTEVAKALAIIFMSLLIMANPKFFVNLPNYAGMLAQYLTISATTSAFTESGETALCSVSTNGSVSNDKNNAPSVVKNGKINKDGITDWLDELGDSVSRKVTCKYWELFALTPWSLGQYGTTINNLWAKGKAPQSNTYGENHTIGYHPDTKTASEMPTYPGLAAVPLGNNQFYHNWAIYQISTQTNAHIPGTISNPETGKIEEKPSKPYTDLGQLEVRNRRIDATNGDWWRVVDAVSGYDTKAKESSGSGSSSRGGSGSQMDKALDWAQKIAQSPDHGYDQGNRNGPDYDCSSLVSHALKQAGFNVNVFSTVNEPDELTKAGFKLVDGANFSTGDGLKAGDILLKDGHTEFYLGGGNTLGAHANENNETHGGQPGDQTGNEIGPGKLTDNAWTSAYRYGDGASSTTSTYNASTGDSMDVFTPKDNSSVTEWWSTWVGGDAAGRLTIAFMSLFACLALIGPIMLGVTILMASIMGVLLMAFAPVIFIISLVPNIGVSALQKWGGMLWATVVRRGVIGVVYMLMIVVTANLMNGIIGLGDYLKTSMLLVFIGFAFVKFKDRIISVLTSKLNLGGESAVSSRMARLGKSTGKIAKRAGIGVVHGVRSTKVRDTAGEVQQEAVVDKKTGDTKTDADGNPMTRDVSRRAVEAGTVKTHKHGKNKGQAKVHKHGKKKGQEKTVGRFGSIARSVAHEVKAEVGEQITNEIQQTQIGRTFVNAKAVIDANREHTLEEVKETENPNGEIKDNRHKGELKCQGMNHEGDEETRWVPASEVQEYNGLMYCNECMDNIINGREH